MRTTRTGFVRLVGAVAAGLLAVAGCTSSTDNNTASPSANEQITLKVGLFGTFGYKEAGLYDKYMATHPNIKIVEQSVELEQNYWQALQTHLTAGSGLSDVQGIEVARIADVVANQADKWTDLNTLGAADLKSTFFEWKWDAGATKDGNVLGLGTDIGPEGICYRKDLFQQAGLPTNRQQLGQMWSTWDKFLSVGNTYKAHAPKNSAFHDTASGLFNAVIGQYQEQYYDANGNLTYETNPNVKTAWNLAMQAATQNLTAKLRQFDTAWNSAFSTGAFATIACPAWMLGYIKGQAGDKYAGKWDVAPLPGTAGNWGGSYLGIPKASTHAKEAYNLIKWLTAPEQQVAMFTKEGHYPSSSTAAADQRVASASEPYFNNAPTGKLFSAAALKMPIAFNGPKAGVVQNNISNGIVAVEQQGKSPDEAWAATVKAINDALGQ